MKTILASLLLSALFLAPGAYASPVVGQASVIDGDTLDIHGQRIRFHGVDAPESSQLCYQMPSRAAWRCGQKAALALDAYIAGRTVTCQPRETDRYNRLISVCSAGGVDLNAWMVSQGWAVAYVQYSRDYVSLEGQARAASRGIWSGVFEAPWDFRASKRPAR